MILITADEGPAGLATSIGLLERQLADLRAEMEVIYERIKGGELEQIRNASRITGEIRQWLKIALEAEVQLEKHKSKEEGVGREFAIDFDAARSAIRGQLDRLARARDD